MPRRESRHAFCEWGMETLVTCMRWVPGCSRCASTTAPGYRVYYLHAPGLVVILLCGGDKSTQRADISHARSIADEWEQQ